jgi:carbamoylphosphate synthase large subunit
MLLDIIRDIIIEMNPSFSASDTLSDSVSKEIKDLAKKLFFEGKINDLKDYIYNLPNEKNETTHKLFIESIQPWLEHPDQFITKFKDIISQKTKELNLPLDIFSLLEILNYGHLKGFLSMFKL